MRVIGPTSTMPGSLHAVPARQACDRHPDRSAVKRVQGETDSMGAELNDMCAECYAEFLAYQTSDEATQARCGICDWCKNSATDLRQRRDFEEGLSGRLYMVCGPCVTKENEALLAEMEGDDFRNSRWSDVDDDDDHDVDDDDDDDEQYNEVGDIYVPFDPEYMATDEDIQEYRASRRPVTRA